jgi:hypothetical protein
MDFCHIVSILGGSNVVGFNMMVNSYNKTSGCSEKLDFLAKKAIFLFLLSVKQ